MKLKDLTNQKINQLTVLHKSETYTNNVKWVCMCTCGNIKELLGSALKSGKAISCGCHKQDYKTKQQNETPKLVLDFINYISTYKEQSKQTCISYKSDIVQALYYITNTKGDEIEDIDVTYIKDITISDFIGFISHLDENGNSSSTKARKVASIKAFYNYLKDVLELTNTNIESILSKLKVQSHNSKKKLPSYLTLKESNRLLNSIDGKNKDRDYVIISLFLHCGLRLSELVDIKLTDLNTNSKILTITGKGNKQREIYLSEGIFNTLSNYARNLAKLNERNIAYLFPGRNINEKLSVSTVQKLVKKYLKKAKLSTKKYSTHSLRHTAATLLYECDNVDIIALQKALGHSNISTTQIYAHVSNKKLKELFNSHPLNI